MSDTKIRASDQIKLINEILNEYDGEEALGRIRIVLYGPPPEEPEEKEDNSDG